MPRIKAVQQIFKSLSWTIVHGRGALTKVALVASMLLLVGCGARAEYLASHLDIERLGWDSVRVDVGYAERTVIGGGSPIAADSTVITVLNSSYETLYTGTTGVIPLPDARLGNEERIIIEACGTVKRRQICAQESIESSPKRIIVEEAISYPRAGNLEEGTFRLSFQVERREFQGNEWESIEPVDIHGHMLVWVDGPEAKSRGTVQIPFSRPSGRFDLSRCANYRNFKYYLDSELLDHQSARVTFEIHAGLSGNPVRLASTTKEVRRKTKEDRENDIRYFAEQVTERIIDELGSNARNRSGFAYVDDWHYDSGSRKYTIELEIVWDGRRSDRGRHEIEGVLEVGEDGGGATFIAESGNRLAVRKWRDRTDEDRLSLGRLDIFRDEPGIPM